VASQVPRWLFIAYRHLGHMALKAIFINTHFADEDVKTQRETQDHKIVARKVQPSNLFVS